MKEPTFKCTFQDCIERNGIECADLIKNVFPRKESKFNNPMELYNEICRVTLIDWVDLSDNNRKREHSYPRHAFARLADENFTLTLEDIGRYIDKDHSTIAYYLKQTDEITGVKEKILFCKRIKAKLNL
jgi:chromosomal replication initiation ATPase DnaA